MAWPHPGFPRPSPGPGPGPSTVSIQTPRATSWPSMASLLQAVSEGGVEGVRAALHAGQDIERMDSYGNTALLLAAEGGLLEVGPPPPPPPLLLLLCRCASSSSSLGPTPTTPTPPWAGQACTTPPTMATLPW